MIKGQHGTGTKAMKLVVIGEGRRPGRFVSGAREASQGDHVLKGQRRTASMP